MRIAVIGAGKVGAALGRGWARAGHRITFGVTDPSDARHRSPAEAAGGARVVRVAEAAAACDALVLAVPWGAVPEVVAACGDLAGRLVVDVTNPLEFGPRGLQLAIGFDTSGGEVVAGLAAGAYVFKTMNQTGFAVMAEGPAYAVPPSMLVAGDDAERKRTVLGLVRDLGFDARDAGPLDRARLLEPYAMLWIEQATLHGMAPTTAFALVDKDKPA